VVDLALLFQFDPDLGEFDDESPEVFSVLSVTFSECSFDPIPSSADAEAD